MQKRSYKELGLKDDCYGCGMCATVCNQGVLQMRLNNRGFYTPYVVQPDRCVDCGLCVSICSYANDTLPIFDKPIGAFAGWSNQQDTRCASSSGGVAMEIAKYGILNGYKICAVRYNNELNRAEHYVAKCESELQQSVGSKYLQSFTFDGFSQINLNEKNIIFGTPCQIDMWRHYIRRRNKEENFILVDFFCHGVPTMNLWNKYIQEQVKVLSQSIFTWRDKMNGWHSSWNICAYSLQGEMPGKCYYRSSAINDKDLFYSLFLGNYCLNASCYGSCKYKKCNSSADIRLGDFWGQAYSKIDSGVNSILVFNHKGQRIIDAIDIKKKIHGNDDVFDGQILGPIKKPWFYNICSRALRCSFLKLSRIHSAIILEEIISYKIKKLFRRIDQND